MIQDNIYSVYDIISYLLPIFEAFLRSCCFYRLIKPFMDKKAGAACGGAVYFLTILLFYLTHLSRDVYIIYGTACAAMLLVLCRMDRRNYRQKILLTVIFSSLSWFAEAMAEILYHNLYDFAACTNYMQQHLHLSSALYGTMCFCYLLFEFAFTFIGIRQVLRVYTNKRADTENRELVMLSLPPLMGLAGYEIMRYYRMFYALNAGKTKMAYDSLTLLYCAMSGTTIIVVIVLYQLIKTKQAENLQAELLATQIDNMRQHVEQVESLYRNIRGVKHDMANHILVLEKLYERNQTEEAKAYGKDLKQELTEIAGEIKSGNPIADVILQEQQKEAAKRDISFRSEFYYPVDSGINALDLSIALNNALQNAIENTENGGFISIISYRQNNAYMIEITNSYRGQLQWDMDSGLPVSSKAQKEGHGYGLSNIRRVAGKYAGDIDIVIKDGTFCLCIMMMTE